MEDKKILFDNIDKIYTTEMGIDRIKRNLKIDTTDAVGYCINKILDKNCNIYKKGKIGIARLELSKLRSILIVIQLSQRILLSKFPFYRVA